MNIKRIDEEGLNGVYKEISKELGVDVTVRIYEMFKGCQINFPIRLFSTEYIRSEVMKNFTGCNIKELAIKYDFSERTIRRIISVDITREKK